MDFRLDLVGVLTHKSICGPLLQADLDVIRHGDQVKEWFEALVDVIEVWIWCLWETEEDFSVVELLDKVMSLVDILIESEGVLVEICGLFKTRE